MDQFAGTLTDNDRNGDLDDIRDDERYNAHSESCSKTNGAGLTSIHYHEPDHSYRIHNDLADHRVDDAV